MPLPLVWLGAAAVSALAVKELADDRKKQQQSRRRYPRAQSLADIGRHDSPIAIYPTDMFKTEQMVEPKVGSIVCCGIGGLLDHSGIWIGENTIVELNGEGLIKPISVERFTKERSGKHIFVACDSLAKPLASEQAAQRAISQIYQYRDYHLIENNCHQFIWQCFQPNDARITTFKSLNIKLAQLFNRVIYWDLYKTTS
ncbi:hypothetical protein [Thalassotalea marina]|uniref:LRAT domain-containing protein n=1 Tax=Thalassotalea marina TaxID=1673741 RepID=A0A919EQ10_9GAMM|nr:hypothetical protein [Thalassotalea marina]GHG08411.1 hypothetical protein GCM10017161_42730 [Thalassotalea marina]